MGIVAVTARVAAVVDAEDGVVVIVGVVRLRGAGASTMGSDNDL